MKRGPLSPRTARRARGFGPLPGGVALDQVTWVLTWRLMRAQGLAAAALAVTAAAVSAALLMLTFGVHEGFAEREERTRWRTPVAAPAGQARAVQAVDTTFSGERPIHVIEVAPAKGRTLAEAPVPPGAGAFPRPGEVWVSPALAALDGGERLVPGKRAGTLGPAALAHPDELVAVVGRAVTDAAMRAVRVEDPRRPGDVLPPTPIASFAGAASEGGLGGQYRNLATVGAVLVVVPLVSLGASAARLTMARRDRRLAALRLLGASPGRIAGVTLAEALLTGGAGALLGILGHLALAPLVAMVPVAGGTWYTADLVLGPLPLLGTVLGVAALVAVSAAIGLRQVSVSPLGVARRSDPPRVSAARALVFVGVIGAYLWFSDSDSKDDVTMVVLFFGAVFGGLSVIGPWAVARLGTRMVRRAEDPARLLAGRRLLDDPKAAWRAVSGVVLAGFVAGFLALMSGQSQAPWGQPGQLTVAVAPTEVDRVRAEGEARLRQAGVPTPSGTTTDWVAMGAENDVSVTFTVDGGPEAVDRARGALAGLVPGRTFVTGEDTDWAGRVFGRDFRTAGVVILGMSLVVATASAAVTAMSAVADRARTYRHLYLAGTPLTVLDEARRHETVTPLVVLGGLAIGSGIFCSAPLTVMGGSVSVDLPGLATLAACAGLGVAGMTLAARISRPLLHRTATTRAPLSE
ncbi:FtsX-like permease family protein (plasmid) [Streptomyces sp. BI20]|uniref:FtsX-like permease family protein n=1 Tax=Streptomyces sp. BI20 TaxID=3403460 RepID=UPI003C79285D